jgi:hypothetical protein
MFSVGAVYDAYDRAYRERERAIARASIMRLRDFDCFKGAALLRGLSD